MMEHNDLSLAGAPEQQDGQLLTVDFIVADGRPAFKLFQKSPDDEVNYPSQATCDSAVAWAASVPEHPLFHRTQLDKMPYASGRQVTDYSISTKQPQLAAVGIPGATDRGLLSPALKLYDEQNSAERWDLGESMTIATV